MRRLRIGIFDITVVLLALVAVLLPDRQLSIGAAYEVEPPTQRAIALAQAELARDPGNGEAAARLSRLLAEAGQTDWAIQVAGNAAHRGSDTAWRALLAVSAAHGRRVEADQAHEYARRALLACREAGNACPLQERVRLQQYFDMLDAGKRSGIDPRLEPRAYQEALQRAMRLINVRGIGTGAVAPGDTDDGAPDVAGEEAPPTGDDTADDGATP